MKLIRAVYEWIVIVLAIAVVLAAGECVLAAFDPLHLDAMRSSRSTT